MYANPVGNDQGVNKPLAVLRSKRWLAPIEGADVTPAHRRREAAGPAYIVLGGISFSHFLNDTMQSLIPSVYPILKESYALDFAQIGLITLAFQFTASLLQPVVGHFTDKKAQPFSLAVGMGSTFFGLLLLSVAHDMSSSWSRRHWSGGFGGVSSGIGAHRAAASGGRYGFAQSVFQVGGSLGSSMGPVLAALIVVPFGQPSIAWFSSIAFLAIVILWRIGIWYRPQIAARKFAPVDPHPDAPDSRRVMIALAVLVALLFSKQLYVSSLSSYYIFYLIDSSASRPRRRKSISSSFSPPTRWGFFGGPLGDRFGRKIVIWFSILGALPFTLALPYAGLYASAVLTRVYRHHHLLDDFLDHRVRAGTGTAPLRDDFRRLLRCCIRNRRPWRRRARQGRRPYRHRLRLPGLLVPAGDRAARGLSAEDAQSSPLTRQSFAVSVNHSLGIVATRANLCGGSAACKFIWSAIGGAETGSRAALMQNIEIANDLVARAAHNSGGSAQRIINLKN